MAISNNTILTEFRQELIREEKSMHTIRAYVRDVEEFMQWFEETVEQFSPEKINFVDIQEYKGYLHNVKKLNPASTNRKLSALDKFFEFLVSTGRIENNPTARVKKVKFQNVPKIHGLSKSELYRMKRCVYMDGNKRNIAIFELIMNTGLREAEVCNIELDDLVLSERKGHVVVRSGKGDKYRIVPLNATARRAIKEYLEIRPDKGNFLFVSQKSDKMSESALYRVIKKYADMANIDAFPHKLRNTYAIKLLREGDVDLPTLQELLGHANINTTARYLKATMEDLEKAVETLDGIND